MSGTDKLNRLVIVVLAESISAEINSVLAQSVHEALDICGFCENIYSPYGSKTTTKH